MMNEDEFNPNVVVLVHSTSSAWKQEMQDIAAQGMATFGLDSGYAEGMIAAIEGGQSIRFTNSDGRARMVEALADQIELYFSGAAMPYGEVTVE